MNRCWWVGLLIGAQLASAQPSGQASFAFGPEDIPVWNLSGAYAMTTPVLGAGDTAISLNYTVVIDHQARGTLTGDGTTILRIDEQPVAVFYTVRGSVTGSGGVTHATFTVTLRGRDWLFNTIRGINVRASYRLEVDAQTNPEAPQLFGRVRGSTSISGLGSGTIREDAFSMPLPPGADGTWAVSLNFIPFKHFAGAASIFVSGAVSPNNPPNFPQERVMAASVKGSYSAGKDLTKAVVKTLYEERGASLTLTFYGENELNTVRGKLLGQNLRFDAAAPGE